MWVYDSPIGPLYIVRTDDGQYGFLYNGIIWEACPTPLLHLPFLLLLCCLSELYSAIIVNFRNIVNGF